MLHVLAGINKFHSGTVEVLGCNASKSDSFKKSMGLVTQERSLFQDLKAAENLDYIAVLKNAARENIPTLVRRFELEKFLSEPVGSLEDGPYKRLSLACALLNSPVLLIVDELTRNIDPHSLYIVLKELAEFLSGGGTCVWGFSDSSLGESMFKQCLSIMNHEIFHMWRDRGLRWILLAGPLLGVLLFYATYSAQVLKNIPTAVVDLDRTSASHELVEHIKSSEDLKVLACPDSFDELEELIKQGKVAAGVVIPENFAKNVSLGRQAHVEMILDGSNMVYATNATSALLKITRTAGAQAGIKALVARGIQPDQARDAYQSIVFREEPWFNPALNYAFFLVVALALNVWQQCCTLAACMNIIGEAGTKSWLQVKAAGFSRFKLFFSKSLVHIAIFMLTVLPIYVLAYWIFKFPLHCSFAALLLFTLAFAVALHGVGTLASSLSRSAVDATRFGMLIALPAFILSGYTWPLEAMPSVIQHAVKALPQTWFFQGFNYLTFKNPGWDFMSGYFLALLIIAAACYGAAAALISRR